MESIQSTRSGSGIYNPQTQRGHIVPTEEAKSRRLAKQHVEAVKQEVAKLKEAGAIKEVFFSEWLSNTMVVKKKNGKWRVCEDFTDFN